MGAVPFIYVPSTYAEELRALISVHDHALTRVRTIARECSKHEVLHELGPSELAELRIEFLCAITRMNIDTEPEILAAWERLRPPTCIWGFARWDAIAVRIIAFPVVLRQRQEKTRERMVFEVMADPLTGRDMTGALA